MAGFWRFYNKKNAVCAKLVCKTLVLHNHEREPLQLEKLIMEFVEQANVHEEKDLPVAFLSVRQLTYSYKCLVIPGFGQIRSFHLPDCKEEGP